MLMQLLDSSIIGALSVFLRLLLLPLQLLSRIVENLRNPA